MRNKKLYIGFSTIIIVIIIFLVYFNLNRNNQIICGININEINDLNNLSINNVNPNYINSGNIFGDDNNWLITLAPTIQLQSIESPQFFSADLCLALKLPNGWKTILKDNLNNVSLINNKSPIEFKDINGDQQNDLLLLNSIGYGGLNIFYNAYINKQTLFIKVNNFEQISNPMFDYSSNELISSMKIAQEWFTQKFKIDENGNLIEIK
jgi:hypothetical protein